MARRFELAVLMCLLMAVSCVSAWSMFEDYLPGGARVTMKFTDWDVGTTYSNLVDDTEYESGGTPDLDALPWTDPANGDPWRMAAPGVPLSGGAALEDTWGIFRLTDIHDTDTDETLWDSEWLTGDLRLKGNPAFEVTGIFWGEVDKSVKFDSSAGRFEIKGESMHFAFFEDTAQDFDFTLGPTSRDGGAAARNPVYDTATDGDLILTGNSVVGDPDASPYEFWARFTPGTSANGDGSFLGNSGAVPYWGAGPLNSLIANVVPGIDYKFQFTAALPGRGPWALKSQDPIQTEITPELSSTALLFLGMLPVGIMGYRRRKRS